jgi:hypothetical protein
VHPSGERSWAGRCGNPVFQGPKFEICTEVDSCEMQLNPSKNEVFQRNLGPQTLWFRPYGDPTMTPMTPMTRFSSTFDLGCEMEKPSHSSQKPPMKRPDSIRFRKFFQKGIVSLKDLGLTVLVLTNKAVQSR